MRSPNPTPGRNRIFEKIWRFLTVWSRTEIEGQQRPRSGWRNWTYNDTTQEGRDYDLEIPEIPVRNPNLATQLIELRYCCSEAATAYDAINGDAWTSHDGDDQGFDISDTLNDNKTKVDPKIQEILRRVIREVLMPSEPKIVGERLLAYGDSFASLGINSKAMRIERILYLPTWEMFRLESKQGELLGFEQRALLRDPDPIQFHPISIVHWRYRRDNLYGRALFLECLKDWCRIEQILDDIAEASHAVGINPNIHILPCEYDEEQANEYKIMYEGAKNQKILTDLYMYGGGDIKKLSNSNPDITALLKAAEFFMARFVRRSRIPPWMLGFPGIGAREISGGPERAYARLINDFRQSLSTGFKQIFNLELALQGYPREQWQYRIVWPRFYIDPFKQQLDPDHDESNSQEIEDLDYLSMISTDKLTQELNKVLNGKNIITR
jgi:hypothetical protein